MRTIRFSSTTAMKSTCIAVGSFSMLQVKCFWETRYKLEHEYLLQGIVTIVYQARPSLTLQKRERRMLLVFMSCWPIRSYCSILSQLLATHSASVVRVLLVRFLGCRLNQLWTMNTNTIWRAEGWLPSTPRKAFATRSRFSMANKCAWSLDRCLLKLLIVCYTPRCNLKDPRK